MSSSTVRLSTNLYYNTLSMVKPCAVEKLEINAYEAGNKEGLSKLYRIKCFRNSLYTFFAFTIIYGAAATGIAVVHDRSTGIKYACIAASGLSALVATISAKYLFNHTKDFTGNGFCISCR